MSLAWSTAVRLLTVCSVLVALAAGAAWAHPAQSEAMSGEAVFVVSGRGWGHGVGMSQYGAYGMANAGHTHEEILAHYYSGTELGQAPTKQVRVLLAEARPAVTISSRKPFTALDARGETYKLAPGAIVLRSKLKLSTKDGPVKAASPLLIRPGKDTPLAFDGVQYRGSFELAVQGNFIRVVNVVPLDSYLSGVVANEMPYTWPSEALKAQAVAARSYALANVVKGKPFDLYSDVRSQVYRGVAGEKPQTTGGGARDSGSGRPLRRQARDDLLLLDLGREDRQRSRRVRDAGPVPPVASGPVGQGVAASHVGPVPVRRPHARRRSSGSTIACSTQSACRRRPVGCAHSLSRPTTGSSERAFQPASEQPRAPLDLGHASASCASISRARPSFSGRRCG